MAEFCKQCSEELFDKDYGNFAGQSTAADTKNGLFSGQLCESCGLVLVDHTGKCVDIRCPKHGSKKR